MGGLESTSLEVPGTSPAQLQNGGVSPEGHNWKEFDSVIHQGQSVAQRC